MGSDKYYRAKEAAENPGEYWRTRWEEQAARTEELHGLLADANSQFDEALAQRNRYRDRAEAAEGKLGAVLGDIPPPVVVFPNPDAALKETARKFLQKYFNDPLPGGPAHAKAPIAARILRGVE